MKLEEMKINLRTLWTEDYSNLPDWVDSENVIYKIKNLVNHKVYIGQAKWFYGRLVGNKGEWSHLGYYKLHNKNHLKSRYLYNAISKYKSRNFEVSIIDICEDNLSDREIYWISYYNSYEGEGYNMTAGGEDFNYLHTDSAIKAQIESNKRNHGGVLSLHTPEALAKAWNTRAKYYNGDGSGQLHTPEARQVAYNAIAAQYNGDGYGQIHTDESFRNSAITTLFKSINKKIQQIKDRDSIDKVSTWEVYWNRMPYCYRDAIRHVRSILNRIEYMRQDPRWTQEMENIFGYIEIHREEYGI